MNTPPKQKNLNLTHMLEALKSAVKEAGKTVLDHYGDEYSTAQEESFPVTEADLASEKILKNALSAFPEYDLLSEEQSDREKPRGDKVFIIDPLDGTKDFVHKTGEFAVMLAVIEQGQPTMGLIYKPTEDELYYAVRGEGAFLEKNGQKIPLKVSGESDFSHMNLLTSRFHLSDLEQSLPKTLNLGGTKPMGSAGLKMCTIARKEAHIYFNLSSKTGEWDSAPGTLIVEEAGGKVTDLSGKPLTFNKKEPYNSNGFVVSNGKRHQEIINALSNTA